MGIAPVELRRAAAPEPPCGAETAAATPFYLGGAFAWLHRGVSRRGLVLCPPVGSESDCAHRALHDLACELAAAGVTVLRISYPGCGDSLPADPALPPTRAWIDSIKHAWRWLGDAAGCEEVGLAGFRLGSTLAAVAAEELGGVERLVMLAPVASGEAYIRERAMLARMGASAHGTDDGEAMDGGGLAFTPQLTAALKSLKLSGEGAPAARKVLSLVRPGMSRDRQAADRLEAQGAQCETAAFDGYAALMVNPEDAAYPKAAFAGVVAWMAQDLDDRRRTFGTSAPMLAEARFGAFVEAPVRIEGEIALAGVFCSPARPRRGAPVVLFLNTGSIPRAGMSAMWVGMARALAKAGVASLRFDLAGVGDSPSRPGRRRPFYDMEAAFADTGAAIGWLAARGFGKVTLAGFCWGAQLATNLAFRDLRVTGLALVNARRQFWEMDAPQAPPIGRRDLYRMVRDPAMWRKLTDLRTLPRRSALASARIGLRALEKLGVAPPPRDGGPEAAAAKLRSLAGRGVDSLILQGSADTFLEEFEAYFGVPREELPEVFGMSMAFPAGVDHLIRTREDMDAIAAAVVRHVSAPTVPARKAG